MKKKFLLIILSSFLHAQEKIVIKDNENKEPIEYARIEIKNERIFSNKEGEFFITAENKDSIKIKRLGYEDVNTTYDKLKNEIYLIPKVFNIEEVIVSQFPDILKKSFYEIEKNYPLFPYSENFNMRIVLKKNGKINKFEDIIGTINRKTLFGTPKVEFTKNNFSVQINGLKKVNIKESNVDYVGFSFYDFLLKIGSLYISPKEVTFKVASNDIHKVTFVGRKEKATAQGYYYIDDKDFAIKEFYLNDLTPDASYVKTKGVQFRTVFYEVNTFYQKADNAKYFISSSKLHAIVEVIDTKGERIEYDCEYFISTKDNFTDIPVKTNISLSEDLFEIKTKKNSKLIESIRSFKLTDEMEKFLNDAKSNPNNYITN